MVLLLAHLQRKLNMTKQFHVEVDDMFEAAGISSRPPGEAFASALLPQLLKSMIVSGVATSPHSSSFT